MPLVDVVAIKKAHTGSGKTELHRMTHSSRYGSFDLQTPTGLHETDDTFQFLMAENRDLFCIKKSRTGSNKTEVHVLSAASNYRDFVLQTGTALHETDHTWAFALGHNRDLYGIKKSNTGSGKTEIHVLTHQNNYAGFSLQTGTGLHPTDDNWEFLIGHNNDLYCIKKRHTGSNKTEVHILTADSRYQNFCLQTPTALEETDHNWQFAISRHNDIYGFKKAHTGSGRTEVHVLPRENNYNGQFAIQTGTALEPSDKHFEFVIGHY